MPDLWFNDDHFGTSTANVGNDFVSVTIARPQARTAMNGKKPFIAKAVGFKCCAAPTLGQKMYGRVSTADGSVYDNSYIGNTISWQKEAKVTYLFQAINLHFADDGGQKVRCWLVSGGPFLYAASGDGKPIGFLRYAEVALPPTGLTVVRDPTNMNKVSVTWNVWDVKKDLVSIGGTYSLSGYCVQCAKDPSFTKDVRVAYLPAKKKGAPASPTGTGDIYGLYQGWDWYFRIATRNEVSDKYKLTGGIWSDPIMLPLTKYVPPTPAGNLGIGGSQGTAADGTDTGSSGAVSANNPSATSNLSSGTASTKVNTIAKAITDQAKVTSAQLKTSTAAAAAHPTSSTWSITTDLLSNLGSLITAELTQSPTNAAAWQALQVQLAATQALVVTASTAAGGTQGDALTLDAALQAVNQYFATLQTYGAQAQTSGTTTAWQRVQAAANDIASAAAPLAISASLPAGTQSLWASAIAAASACAQAAGAYLTASSASTRASGLAAIVTLVSSILAAENAGGVNSAAYSAASASVTALLKALATVLKGTSVRTGTSIDPSAGSTGTAAPTPATDTSTDASDGGTDGSASTGDSTSGSIATTVGSSVVYVPIPDTSAMRVPSGGVLLSQDPPGAIRHTAFIMDRGGRDRIGQLKNFTTISYNRIRDDQSVAQVTLDAQAVAENRAVLDLVSVGRHELLIYRGQTRVWEGPLTHSQITKSAWVLDATDITHYLNRTVVKNSYSNAGSAMDFTVNRLAGIMANELSLKESLDPPYNILPFIQTNVQSGDARTTRTSVAGEFTVWQHLDDLAAKGGIDYTVIGRSLIMWDTSRAAIGTTRTITADDFDGDPYIAYYGMDLATAVYVSDGQGDYGMAGGIDDYYGEIELLSGAYDENGNAVDGTDGSTTQATISVTQLDEQAVRNLVGRNPTPVGLHVPDNSGFRLDRGIGLDVLIPGVYMPVQAVLAGVTIGQLMKLKEVKVTQDYTGENVVLTLTPASSSDTDEYLLNSNDPIALSS